jgi:hypothetical protein
MKMSTPINYRSVRSDFAALPAGRAQLNVILLQSTHPELDDPGTPGGDPDLPETPIDSGVFVLIIIALVFGFFRIRSLKANPQ